MAADTPQREFNLREYWQIFARRRWTIYTCVLVATFAAVVSSLLATNLYRATCTISIERSGVRLLKQDLASAEPSWLDYQNWYNTQYKIIESDRVLRKAVDDLGAPRLRRLIDPKGTNPNLAEIPTSGGSAAEESYYPYVKFLHGGLSVDPVRDSHLILLSFVSADRKFSADAANAIADAYKNFTLESRLDIARDSEKFFTGRIEELRKEINDAEKISQNFATEHNLLSGDSDEATLKNFNELRERLTKAKADLAEAAGKYQAYQGAPPDSLAEVRETPLFQQLSAAAADAERDYREKMASYGSEYPDVRKARVKMEETRDKLQTATANLARQAVESARVAYVQNKNQVDELNRLFEQSRETADKFQGPYGEYVTLKKMVEAKRATLNELLDKENQMSLSANLGETGNNVRVIDDAQPPHGRFKPKLKLNTLLGFLFGLFLGVGGAVLMEYIDNTLKTPDDIRQVLNLPVLGMIPAQTAQTERRQAIGRYRRGAAAAPAQDVDPALVALQAPLSPIAEAYRELRTAILLATPGHPPRDVAVTSCQPGEGKTTTVVNLALALAQLGRKVLVVDTDLRRPRCHQVLRAPSERGVSTYLTGNSDFESLIIPTLVDNVSLLPAGPIPPNPAELLDADRFRDLVASLRTSRQFDHVIFDSPPVLSVVDPLLIGRQVEGVVLVVKSAFTSRDSGRLGKEKLLAGRVTVLGVLLNAVPTEHVPYQYRYYRYGYAKKEGKTSEKTPAAAGVDTGEARPA